MNPTFLDLIAMWAEEKKYHPLNPKPGHWVTLGDIQHCWTVSIWPSGYVQASSWSHQAHPDIDSEFLLPADPQFFEKLEKIIASTSAKAAKARE